MDQQLLTDHLWFNYGKGFQQLGKLVNGDRIQFNGRISTYDKTCYSTQGVRFKVEDYQIARPTKIKLLSNHPTKSEPIPHTNSALIGMILLDNQQFYQANARGTDDDKYYIQQYHHWQATL